MRSLITYAAVGAILAGLAGLAEAAAQSAGPNPDLEKYRLLPSGQSIATVANNPYLALGIRAATEGLRTATISLPAQPSATLGERINLAHLGLGMAGWTFISQATVESSGTSTQVLLTYRR